MCAAAGRFAEGRMQKRAGGAITKGGEGLVTAPSSCGCAKPALGYCPPGGCYLVNEMVCTCPQRKCEKTKFWCRKCNPPCELARANGISQMALHRRHGRRSAPTAILKRGDVGLSVGGDFATTALLRCSNTFHLHLGKCKPFGNALLIAACAAKCITACAINSAGLP